MEAYKTILTHSLIQLTILKIERSLEMIKEKSPQRTDLIESMSKSLLDLHEVKETVRQMEVELKAYGKRNFDLEEICIRYASEIRELKERNENLIKGL